MSFSHTKSRVLIVLSILLSFSHSYGSEVITLSRMPLNYVQSSYMSGMNNHVGELCVACHWRFSADKEYADKLPYKIEDPKLSSINPCGKNSCHYSTSTGPTAFVPGSTSRWSLHLNTCDNCHPRWNSSIETVHNTHLNFSYLTLNRSGVECKLCHFSPRGYNSSIVAVPQWEEGYDKEIYVAPWNNSCAFCHFTIKNAKRVHDVHEPVLLKTCVTCHSEYIVGSPRMFQRIGLFYPYEEEKPKTSGERIIEEIEAAGMANKTNITQLLPSKVEKISPITELYLYFEGIILTLRYLIAKV